MPKSAMGIVTKWAVRLQTLDFYGPSPSTPSPSPMLGFAPPPPFDSRSLLHDTFTCPPPYHTLLWKM